MLRVLLLVHAVIGGNEADVDSRNTPEKRPTFVSGITYSIAGSYSVSLLALYAFPLKPCYLLSKCVFVVSTQR